MTIKLLVLLTVSIISALSCTNPFDTRADEVEAPDQLDPSDGTIFEAAVDPETVFTNFRKALARKNIDEYMRCFIPVSAESPHTFTFEPEQAYKNEFSYSGWSLQEERLFFERLTKSEKNNYPVIDFAFIDGDPQLRPITQTSENDSVESVGARYRLSVNYSVDSSAVYEGISRFKLFKNSDLSETWHIYYWQDRTADDQNSETLTKLKIDLYNQNN